MTLERLTGNYCVSLDGKRRIILPKELRNYFRIYNKGYVGVMKEKNLIHIVSRKNYENRFESFKKLPYSDKRRLDFVENNYLIRIDTMGRISLSFVDLNKRKNLEIIFNIDRATIRL